MKNMDIFDNCVDNPKDMEIRVFPAEDGSFTLWEDAGDTAQDAEENWAATQLTFTGGSKDEFVIGKALIHKSIVKLTNNLVLLHNLFIC